MQHILTLLLWFSTATVQETTKLELTSQGFNSIEIKTPNKPLENLMEASKAWATYYNKNGVDVTNVTENSLTIDAKNENAFYLYNVGNRFDYDVKYSIKITFNDTKKYTLALNVTEIYTENVLQKITPADFFTADGKLKDDYRDAKPSLEKTANNIVKSFSTFIAQK